MAAISPDLEQFVTQEVASGRYANRDSVIAHGLTLLRRDRQEALAGIEAGIADVAAGRVQLLDEAFDELYGEFGIRKGA